MALSRDRTGLTPDKTPDWVPDSVRLPPGGQVVTAFPSGPGLRSSLQPFTVPLAAILGNSFTARNSNYPSGAAPTGNTFLYGGSGYMVWANILSGQRVKLPKNYIYGFVSKTVGEFFNLGMASVQALVPAPAVIVIGDATNNLVRSDGQQTFDAIINGVTAGGVYYPGLIDCIKAAQALGARVILMPINPRTDVVLTAAQVGVAMQVNKWILEVARTNYGIATPDYLRDIVDPSSTLYGWRAGCSIDLLHTNIFGGYYMGKGVAKILREWFPAVDRLPLTNAVVDTTNARYLPRNPNPMLLGTTGTLANGASGTAPTSYTLGKIAAGDASLTVAGSLVAATADPNFTYAQIALGGSFTSAGMSGVNADITHGARLYGNITGTDLLAGDVVEAYCAVEVDAGTSGIAIPSLIIRDGPNSYYNHAAFPGDGGGMPPEAWQGVLYTGEFVVPTDAPALQYHHSVYCKGDTAGSVTVSGNVRYGRTAVYKV